MQRKSGEAAVAADVPAATGGAAPADGAQRKKKIRRILIVTLCLVAAAALVFGLVKLLKSRHAQQEAEIAARRELLALQENKTAADKLLGEIQASVTSIVEAEAAARPHFSLASNAVFAVLGETMEYPQPAPAPVATQAVAAAVAGKPPPTPATNAPAAAKGATNAPTPAATNAATPAATNAAAPAATNAVPAVVAPAAAVAPAAPATPPPLIKVLGTRVTEACAKLVALASQAKTIGVAAQAAHDEAAAAKKSSVSEEKIKTLNGQLEAVQRMDREAATAVQTAQKAAQETEGIRASTAKEREQKRQAEAAAAKKHAEEEAKKKADEEQKALVDAEIQRASASHEETKPLLKEQRYKDAVAALKPKLEDYKTDEGRKALEVIIERYTRLEQLRLFFVERLKADPFRWGWTQGGAQQDILSADDKSIKITSGVIPWNQVGTRQMLQFLRRYLGNDKATASLPLRKVAEMNLAAAIFCYENGGLDAAVRYATKAVELLPTIKDDVQQLLPPDAQPK